MWYPPRVARVADPLRTPSDVSMRTRGARGDGAGIVARAVLRRRHPTTAVVAMRVNHSVASRVPRVDAPVRGAVDATRRINTAGRAPDWSEMRAEAARRSRRAVRRVVLAGAIAGAISGACVVAIHYLILI